MNIVREQELRLSADSQRHRTVQIGPAWIGRAVASLMLRLFTRRRQEHCCGYRWKHTHAAQEERTRERLDYTDSVYWQRVPADEQEAEQPPVRYQPIEPIHGHYEY